MVVKVLTEEDFKEGEPEKETSSEEPEKQEAAPEKEEPSKKEEPEKEEPPKEEKKYKYASMDEYDKAYKEAERKMHEATTRSKELERKISQYERPVVDKPLTLDDRIRDLTKETINKIRLLPADAPTREEDAGFLWAKLQSEITDLKYEERYKVQEKERDVVKRTYDYATKEGIKSDAELRLLGTEFSKTDPTLPTEERISMAVNNTKDLLSQLREGLIERQRQDKQEKEDLKVLGRGSSRTEKSSPRKEEPETMAQALSKLNEQRRMKKDDLRY